VGEGHEEVLAYLPTSLLRAAVEQPARSLPWCDEVEGTMVMADLSGFTALSERLAALGDEGAERLTDIINSFFGRMLKTASWYGGDTLTFGGDAILLLFQGPEHAQRAAVAALEMLKQVERAAAVETDTGKVKIGMSVGAHSDRFVLAGVGLEDERAHLVVIGEGGEMTALAEEQAQRGQFAVSSSCRELLPAGTVMEPSGDFWVVGKLAGCTPARPPKKSPFLTEEQMRLLGPFLPPYARSSRGEDARVQVAPEHRRTVIVFVDLLGLDEIIETSGTSVAVEQLGDYAAMLIGLAAKHNGFVVSSDIATKGSKLIVTFGAPVAHEHAPTNAARFALDLNSGLRESGLGLHHKIGVNGGHVFAGEVGPEFRRQYTVMGDAVNLAARLMAAAELDSVLVSRRLMNYMSHTLCARELPPISVKGKEKPVAICVLEDQEPEGDHIHGAAGSSLRLGRMFGRRRELGILARSWERCRRGEGQSVLIEGEAGVGKTRLLDEALAQPADDPLITRVACFEHLQSAPFTPWVDALSSVLRLSRELSTSERTAAVRRYIEVHVPRLVKIASLLNPLLVLSLPQGEIVGSLDPAARRERLFELIAAIFAEAAVGKGHIIVVEDVHWADESSLALAAHLSRLRRDARILLLLTTRPIDLPKDLRDGVTTSVRVSELGKDEALAMVRAALGADVLPDAVGEAIHDKTKGNPLFLEEVVRALQGPGVLERIVTATSVTRAAELAALEIPDRVQGLLMSRIDRLPADAREILKAGAVVGRSFDARLVEGMGDDVLQSIELNAAFKELVDAALVVPTAGDGEGRGDVLSFRHALVQDVAYESMPFSRRRELHGRLAAFLEATQRQLDHGLLVHHYRHAGNVEKTRLHAVRASESSVAAYANLEAIDYLALALETLTGRSSADAAIRSRLEELTGDSLQTLGQHERAVELLVSARRRWASDSVRAAAIRATAGLSAIDDGEARDSLLCWKISVSLQRGPAAYRRAIRWLDQGMKTLPRGHKVLSARILIAKSVCLCRTARYRESLRLGEQGLRLAREVGESDLVGYGCTVRSLALSQLGQFTEAIAASREAIDAYAHVGDLVGQALAHLNLGLAYQLSDDPRQGLEQMELALAIYVKLGDANGIVQQHHNIGCVLLQLGDLDDGMEHLRETVAARDRPGCPPLPVGWAYVLLAQGHLLRDEVEEAAAPLAEGRAVLESIGADSFLPDTAIVEAQLELARGNVHEAERQCSEVAAAARAVGAAPVEGEALRVLGQALMALGRPAEAVTVLEDCVRLADETESAYARAQGLTVLAEAAAACDAGDPSCEDRLGEAIMLFRKMGTRLDLERALQLRDRLISNAQRAAGEQPTVATAVGAA
jgi:class 3 adenylate cyclase/tetratricopeptide (TPR) repeat protein